MRSAARAPARPPRRRAHSTGLTLLFVVLLTLGLSFAPLPDWARPFPGLMEKPRETVLAAVWPKALQQPKPAAVAPEPVLADVEPAAPEVPSEPELPAEGEEEDPFIDDVELALSVLPEAEQKEARKLETIRRAVGARHVDIEQGCRRMGPHGCEELALAPFFAALDEVKRGARHSPVHVVHLGNSLIASDYITGKARVRLQARHGSGGGGFFFVDRPTPNAGLALRTGRASEGWEVVRITDTTRTAVLGLTGVAFAAEDESLTTSFDARNAQVADVLYLRQPGGGGIDVRVDGKVLAQVSTRGLAATDTLRVVVPEHSRTLTVSTRGRVALYGVAMETTDTGVVYDSIGIPGATARVFLRANEAAFAEQLQARDPRLVVLMLGGNEALEHSQRLTTPERVTEAFRSLIDRVRTGAPEAACLLVSPLAAGVRSLAGEVSSRRGTPDVVAAIRAAALEKGCAFWDMFNAFGGDDSFLKWLEKGLLQDDLVHPKLLGGDLLGHLFDLALTRAQLTAPKPPSTTPAAQRGQRPDPLRLARIFERLRELARGERQRVAMLQLGASHTSAHFFSDQVRRRLAARFGDAGRGFIAAGKPSKRLEPAGVRRELLGNWLVRDARDRRDRDAGVDEAVWGLTGVRAEGAPDARLEFGFCTRCTNTSAATQLQLFYVEAPGMGALDVLVDGAKKATLTASDAGPAGGVARVLSFESTAATQNLVVHNRGPGPVAVLGASAEFLRPGVVYDALGLPGSTVFTIAGYERDSLTTQLQARAPDLYVLWYGTNESALPALDAEAMHVAYKRLFVALKSAAPQADCLMIGPTDRMKRQRDGTWAPAPSEETVIAELEQVATEHGCALWHARTAMGGPGSMRAWRQQTPRLAHPDHVHLTSTGYTELADAFVDDLLATFDGVSSQAPAEAPDAGAGAPDAGDDKDGG